jgi:hypothetical protein
MAFYDSMVVFEKGQPLRKTAPAIGVERKGLFGVAKTREG